MITKENKQGQKSLSTTRFFTQQINLKRSLHYNWGKRVCTTGFQLQTSDTNSDINKTKSMYAITITHQAIKFNTHLEKAKHCKYGFVPNEKKKGPKFHQSETVFKSEQKFQGHRKAYQSWVGGESPKRFSL